MKQKAYQYIFNNISYSSYMDAHLSGIGLDKEAKLHLPFCICDWTEALLKEEVDFVWHRCKAENAFLLYYNYIADIEKNQYLKSRICASLIDLNPSHLNLDVSCYQKHMRKYSNRLALIIDSCIDQNTITGSPIWFFPVIPSFIKTAVIIQRVKLKYPKSHVVMYGADASMNNEFLLKDNNIDAVVCGSLYSEELLVNFLVANPPKSNFWNKQWYWDESLQQLVKDLTPTSSLGVLFDKLIPYFKEADHSLSRKYYCNITNVDQTLLQVKVIANIHNTATFQLSCMDSSISFESLLCGLLNIKNQYSDISIESIFYDGKITNNVVCLLSKLKVRKLAVDYFILEENSNENSNHTFAEILLNAKLLSRNKIELYLYRKYKSERLWDGEDVLKIKNCLHMLRLFKVSEFIGFSLGNTISVIEEISLWKNFVLYKTNGRVERLSHYNIFSESDKYKLIITPIDDTHFSYQEYMGERCVRSLQLGKIDVLILKLLNKRILSYDTILTALNKLLNMSFLSIRIVSMLEELESERLIYINDNFNQITSCIDFV